MCLYSGLYKLIIKIRIKDLAERLHGFLSRAFFSPLHIRIEYSLLTVCYVNATNTLLEKRK